MNHAASSTIWQKYLTHTDDDSFARVFEAEKDVVWTICVRYLGSGEDAEEAFQSAWLRQIAEGRAGRFNATNAQDHLCRTAAREADALRKRRARRHTREITMAQIPDRVDNCATPDVSLDEAKCRAAMEALVAQLPEKLRLPVQLHYLSGMTQRQVAATLGVPPSTIDSRLKAAREQLRPLAERAGLRDSLTVLAAGGMSAGLLSTPASLTAASVLSASATTATVAVGLLSTTMGKFAAVAAVVVLAVGIGMSVMRPAASETAASEDLNAAVVIGTNEVTGHLPDDEFPLMTEAADTESVRENVTSVDAGQDVAEAEEAETNAEVEVVEIADASPAVAEEDDQKKEEPETRFLSILVVDAQTGGPIPGAEARFRRARDQRIVTTNDQGLARFDDVPVGSGDVGAKAQGYAQASVIVEIGSTDPVLTVELHPGSTLHGIVQNEAGASIPGANVIVSNTSGSFIHQATSDEEGRYEITNVARGIPLNQVYVRHPGYKTYFQHEMVIVPEDADRHEHDIVLEDTAAVSGIVIDAITGRPIANARLHGGQVIRRDIPIATTNAAGRFAVEHFTASNNQILFVANGYAPRAVKLDTAVDGTLRVELERGLVASGVLVDEKDEPIGNINIIVCAESMHNIASTTTGADGVFHFEDLDRGAVFWITPSWQSDSMRYNDMAGKTNERVVIPRSSPVTGRVVDGATGEPLEQFRVRLGFATQRPGDLAPRGIVTSYMNPGMLFDTEDGVFRIASFPPNTAVAVTVEAEGYAPAQIDRVVVTPGAEPITIRMVK